MPPKERKGAAKAPPPPSSPLSSAPSPSLPSSHPEPTEPTSPPSAPVSPEPPKRRARKAPPAKAATAAAPRKAAPRSKGKAAAKANTEPEAPSPRASLDDLLGNMAQDHADMGKRDNKRRKTLDFQPRIPKSDAEEDKPKKTKRKRAQPVTKPPHEASESTESIPSPPSLKKRRQTMQSEEAEEGQSPASTAVTPSRATPSPLPRSPEAGPSSLPAQSSLAGRSALADSFLVDTDDDDDLDVALDRLKADKRKAELEKAADFSDFDDVSDPPSPSQSPPPMSPTRRRTTLHRDVEVGCTCLVKYGHNLWFPAKLLAFTIAADGGKDFYKVATQDGHQSEHHVMEEDKVKRFGRRSKLLWLHERDAIARVKMGSYQTTIVRSRTDAPPENATEHQKFNSLERDEQATLCHDHLANLTAEAYPPAQWRIDLFFGSVAERQSLLQKVEDGDLSLDDNNALAASVGTWIQSGVTGSERFQELSESERSRYASYVLLPEVIIRICMRSMDLNLPESWTGKPPPAVLARIAGQDGAEAFTAEAEEQRMYDLTCQKLKELRRDSSTNEWERRSLEVTFARNQGLSELGLDKAALPQPKGSSRRDRWEDPKQDERRLEAAKRQIERQEQARKKKAEAKAKAAATGEAVVEPSIESAETGLAAAAAAVSPTNKSASTLDGAAVAPDDTSMVGREATVTTGAAADEATVATDTASAADPLAGTAAAEADAPADPATATGDDEPSTAQGEISSTTDTIPKADQVVTNTANGHGVTALEQEESRGADSQAEALVNRNESASVAAMEAPPAEDDGKADASNMDVDEREPATTQVTEAVTEAVQGWPETVKAAVETEAEVSRTDAKAESEASTSETRTAPAHEDTALKVEVDGEDDTGGTKVNGVAVASATAVQEAEVKPPVRRRPGRATRKRY